MKTENIFYPAFITQNNNLFIIQFRNIQCISTGVTLQEALNDTEEALKFALEGYQEVNGFYPEPSEFQHCDIAVQYKV